MDSTDYDDRNRRYAAQRRSHASLDTSSAPEESGRSGPIRSPAHVAGAAGERFGADAADTDAGKSALVCFAEQVKGHGLSAAAAADVVWQHTLRALAAELGSEELTRYLQPTQAVPDGDHLLLLVPNRYSLDWFTTAGGLELVQRTLDRLLGQALACVVHVEVGAGDNDTVPVVERSGQRDKRSRLNPDFTFASFVEGKSNEMARAAAYQVANSAGRGYNPLLLYGGVGLGKTHLMHAVGNALRESNPGAKIVYLHSQRFVQDMVRALRTGTMEEFTAFFRSIDALLIDDIQFFANKLRSQEEFFHVFNALIERDKQMILTCDRYPQEIVGLEDRLKSRFVWGLTTEVERPDLETRVAILMNKAASHGVSLDSDVAFYIAERIRTNVRELEGALTRVIANASFSGSMITIDQVRRTLRDLFVTHERRITIDLIQRMVAEFFNLKVSDLLSAKRNRALARPRQIAMALCKELTKHSLPEIGDAFGGRDHTTVMHACKKVAQLRGELPDFDDAFVKLHAQLTA